jgi:hypothetical protein
MPNENSGLAQTVAAMGKPICSILERDTALSADFAIVSAMGTRSL